VVDPRGFCWSDAAWTGIDRPDLVIYELHVGTFSDEGRFGAAVGQLQALRELGVTALELMPIAQFPGERNWGYDGVFPYAPQNSYGGPDELRRLVDAAHGAGLAVLLDVVYNHLGPEGNVLGDFGPYFTERYRTPWGAALNFDGPESDEVRRYFRDNACHWIDEYHLDGLRLDAVHAIHDQSARPFLAELAAAFRELEKRAGRRLHLIAESDLNDPTLVREPSRGGLGLDAVWSDDFHHAVHAALTGERSGYYVDFGGSEPVARALCDRFVYDGCHSLHRRRRHGAPARDVPADRFVVFVQNHDQVGNRARGERLSVLLPPVRLRLAAALLLLGPYLPLLFMGEEYGETNPFLYFVDHGDAELLEAVRRGRRREFAASHESRELPDPAALETFQRSRLRHARASQPGHAELRALYRDLLRARREEPALRPGAAAVYVEHDATAGWIRVHYQANPRPALAAFHLGATPVEVPGPPDARPWRLRLSSDDDAYGGPGRRAPERLEAARTFPLPAETALLYVGEAS
jgi:maltooligosyltrehalose trehalohydrolase